MRYDWPILIFTDGAFEPSATDVSTIGGVILCVSTGRYEYFSGKLSAEATARLLEHSSNPIAEIEAIGAMVALLLWRDVVVDRAVLAFNDNEAVKAAMIAGTSSSPRVAWVLEVTLRLEIATRSLLWWERVASDSNIADAPSRGRTPMPLAGFG